MKFIADFHIHSHFSLATSKQLTPQYLDYWAKIKGVNVVGTGDFTHPAWTAELKQFLEPAEEGLFKLKKDAVITDNPLIDKPFRFILTAEISNIYKKNGKVRKIHNVILAPDFKTVEKVQKELQNRKFNITSDGRPILGLDSRDLFEILLNINEKIELIPAHIWTPWFAALGSKSGFDTIEECYGDLSDRIFAVETGLSSDQPLNWLCSFLDKFTLLSNSDAHSPEKLGRNANIFDTELSYPAIIKAMKNQHESGFVGTIDMYPQEGKYHFDGHRKCGISLNPTQTMEHRGLCPVCGKPLTLGVAHRIAQLADRDDPLERPIRKDFRYIIPLKEIIGEIFGVKSTGKNVNNIYFKLIRSLGSELDILLNIDTDKIRKAGGEFLAVAIERMRSDKVIIKEGFDGEYGVIKLFEKNEIQNYGSKKSLFDVSGEIVDNQHIKRPLLNFDVAKFRKLKSEVNIQETVKNAAKNQDNESQKKAIEFDGKNAMIIAGPGTGKTFVLTNRIAFLIKNKKILPEKILAVTFSRQAAEEMRQRIEKLTDKQTAEKIKIVTFHALGLEILQNEQNNDFIIINEDEKRLILKKIGVPTKLIAKISQQISLMKNTLEHDENDEKFFDFFDKYNIELQQNNLYDFDDLIYLINSELLDTEKNKIYKNFEHILIDEFQDINNVQFEFIKLLAHEQANIFAIGDPNQAIYGFRGSDVSLLDKFIKKFNATTLSLSVSYRCTDNILSASDNIVKNNYRLSGLNKGVKITISEHPTDKSEAEYIARTIEDMIGGLRFFSIDSKITEGTENKEIKSLSDFAVLVRTKEQFAALTKAFADHLIPVQIIGTKSFLTEKPFNQIIKILKFIKFPDNKFLAEQTFSILNKDLNINTQQSLYELITTIWKKYFAEKGKEDNFDRFRELAKDKTLDEFLKEVELLSGQDDYNRNAEAVNLMTLHASKGLEFQCVFIPGIEDGLIPYSIFRKDTDIDEERRLLYVGMTRSKKFLYLTYAKNRKIKNLRYSFKRSRFLDDIEKDLLQMQKQKYRKKKDDDDKQLSLF